MFALISFNYYVRLNVEIYREREKNIFLKATKQQQEKIKQKSINICTKKIER